MRPETTRELRPNWNVMVVATKAFLARDRLSLLAAREHLAVEKAPQLHYADRLIETFGNSYAEMFWWARVRQKVAVPNDAAPEHRAAMEKLARAFGFSVAAEGSVSA